MFISPVTAADVLTMVQTVVAAHATHNTFYSIWNPAKDRASELTYPCVIWDQWTAKVALHDTLGWQRSQLVRLLITDDVSTERTPAQRDAAVNACDSAASDLFMKMVTDYAYEFSNVLITTRFDEQTTLETGVLLQFTVKGQGLCLNPASFPEEDP